MGPDGWAQNHSGGRWLNYGWYGIMCDHRAMWLNFGSWKKLFLVKITQFRQHGDENTNNSISLGFVKVIKAIVIIIIIIIIVMCRRGL